MSANFSEMNLRSSNVDTYQMYTAEQPYPENDFDAASMYSLQEIPLEELLEETSSNHKYPGESLPTRSQRGLTEVDTQMLSALMEIRDHLPSDHLTGSQEYVAYNPGDFAEQDITESIERDDQGYVDSDTTYGYESELDDPGYSGAPYIDSDFYPDPPSPPPPRHRSLTPEIELHPSLNLNETREIAPQYKSKIRPRPERKPKWAIDPFRQCLKRLDSNLRIAIFTRKDHEKYAKILDKYDQSALRRSRRRREIREKVNQRGLDYQTGFMRWRVHQRSRLACELYPGTSMDGLRAMFHNGGAMAVEGGYLVGNQGQSTKDCESSKCLVGVCGWRGMTLGLFPNYQPISYLDDVVDADMYE
ncbi:hypothetical protein HYFRA_00006464 [Hymenoscyphus fraxineus]|uniref:Uncharacterized protein n=1 Tax=Hymenoscyphus fraxineus TaxID=746836 RepID=A0A9N9PLF5_9HELO|nr:hypothetical protein HYFRA_00006464 [Hymenoscyphus fraxineus]